MGNSIWLYFSVMAASACLFFLAIDSSIETAAFCAVGFVLNLVNVIRFAVLEALKEYHK